MSRLLLLRRQWLLGLFYTAGAGLAIGLTRIDGGVAHLWGATAILFAALVRTSPAHWWAPVIACIVPGAILTIFMGLGLKAAIPFALCNATEAVLAAFFLRRFGGQGETLGSLRWVGAFVLAALLAPLLVSPLVGVTLWTFGRDALDEMFHYVTGHALGSLTFTPLALMFTGPRARQAVLAELRRNRSDTLSVVGLAIAVSMIVFGQSKLSLMFVASMFAIFATFRLGRIGAAISIAVLALASAFATALHMGPVAMMNLSDSGELLMVQFFLAATTLTVLPVAADLRHRQALLAQIRGSEARFRMLAEHSSDIMMHLSPRGHIRYVSPSIEALGGWHHAALVGRNCADFVHPDDLAMVAAEHRRCFEAPGSTLRYRHRAMLADGSFRWVEAHARALADEGGRIEGVLSLLRDITEDHEQQEQWQQAALTDTLTGLPNRRALEQMVEARRSAQARGADCIALLDLDLFKKVNDTYGHDSGDAVLKGFADLARRMIRSHDTVVRLGGEEFVILFTESSVEQAYQVCERMRRVLGRTPLATPAGPLRVTASGGVAVIDRRGLDLALKAADEALYRAKRAGRDQLLLAA